MTSKAAKRRVQAFCFRAASKYWGNCTEEREKRKKEEERIRIRKAKDRARKKERSEEGKQVRKWKGKRFRWLPRVYMK